MATRRADAAHSSAGRRPLLLIHFAAALMAVVDFMVFHIAAVGLAIAIYLGVPLLDDAITKPAADWNWLALFKIVSPTVTVPGGAVTVLSTYFYARRVQEIEKEKQQAEQQRQEEAQARQQAEQQRQEEAQARQQAEQQRQEEAQARQQAEQQRQEEAQARQQAEAELQALRTQLEHTTSRRRNRRRLRSNASQEPQ